MKNDTHRLVEHAVSKVPAVTLGFWIIKIAATTLGETGSDWVTMSLKLGYLIGTMIFAIIFIGLVSAQVKAEKFHPSLYWATIVATTTLGTTMADFADRSLGVGYPGGTAIVFGLLIASLVIWYLVEGTVSVSSITTPNAEWFYWCTSRWRRGDCTSAACMHPCCCSRSSPPVSRSCLSGPRKGRRQLEHAWRPRARRPHQVCGLGK